MEDLSFGSLPRRQTLPPRFLDRSACRAELFKPAEAVDPGDRAVGGRSIDRLAHPHSLNHGRTAQDHPVWRELRS
jgi:hypothetical protein